MNCGYTEEASAGTTGCCARSPARRRTCRSCTASGASAACWNGRPDWLPGYEGAQPVRVGNAAHAQLQLDVYGELIDAFHQARMAEAETRRRDRGTWNASCSNIWRRSGTSPISGIWERRGDGQHYVSSKVMTWVAFDRGIKSAEKFGFKAPLEQWRSAARHHPSRCLRKGLRSRAECVCRILWLATARCQHPAAAGGGLPSRHPTRACSARSRRSKNT